MLLQTCLTMSAMSLAVSRRLSEFRIVADLRTQLPTKPTSGGSCGYWNSSSDGWGLGHPRREWARQQGYPRCSAG